MVIGLQIGKLHGGGGGGRGGICPLALQDSGKPGLFRVNLSNGSHINTTILQQCQENFFKVLGNSETPWQP